MVIELRQIEDLESLLERSHTRPVLIFKHSTHCGGSAAALEEFETFHRENEHVVCGLLLAIENRRLSDEIEERFHIRHETPQAVLVVNGIPIWNASHWKITSDTIRAALGGAAVTQ